jgi:hypothetical protein
MNAKSTAVNSAVANALQLPNPTGSLGVALNMFIEGTPADKEAGTDEELFGKVGYQVPHAGVSDIILANMAEIEAWLNSGKATNLSGEKVTDGAVMLVYMQVNRIKPATNRRVATITNAQGTRVQLRTEAEQDTPSKFATES